MKNDTLLLVALLGGGYLLYKKFSETAEAVAPSIPSAVQGGIAGGISDATQGVVGGAAGYAQEATQAALFGIWSQLVGGMQQATQTSGQAAGSVIQVPYYVYQGAEQQAAQTSDQLGVILGINAPPQTGGHETPGGITQPQVAAAFHHFFGGGQTPTPQTTAAGLANLNPAAISPLGATPRPGINLGPQSTLQTPTPAAVSATPQNALPKPSPALLDAFGSGAVTPAQIQQYQAVKLGSSGSGRTRTTSSLRRPSSYVPSSRR